MGDLQRAGNLGQLVAIYTSTELLHRLHPCICTVTLFKYRPSIIVGIKSVLFIFRGNWTPLLLNLKKLQNVHLLKCDNFSCQQANLKNA